MATSQKITKFSKSSFLDGLTSLSFFPKEEPVVTNRIAWNRVKSCFKIVENNLERTIREQTNATIHK